jgi:hypothetical protein
MVEVLCLMERMIMLIVPDNAVLDTITGSVNLTSRSMD